MEMPLSVPETGSRQKKICILSIDGGGMRGIIPAKALCYLEESLRRKTGQPDAAVADYFDVVAGTSVGAIIATMICTDGGKGRPLFTATEALTQLVQHGKRVFRLPPLKRPFAKLGGILTPRYSARNVESVYRDQLGDATLKHALKTLLVPCYDLSKPGAFIFSSAAARRSDAADFRLHDVCRATSAVPSFFKPANVVSVDGSTSVLAIDGGLVLNNPAAAAVTHVLRGEETEFGGVNSVADTMVLSLGTGLFDRAYKAGNVKWWGAFQWAKPVAKIVLDGISEMVDHSMSMAFSAAHLPDHYLRVQVSGLPSRCLTEMDDPSKANIRRLNKIADDMLDQPCIQHIPFGGKQKLPFSNRERLDWFADCLIAEQKARQYSLS